MLPWKLLRVIEQMECLQQLKEEKKNDFLQKACLVLLYCIVFLR